MMNFLKGILMLIGFCVVFWMIFNWSEDLCLDGGYYCDQKFCGYPEKIKACEQASIESEKMATPERKAASKRIRDYMKTK